MIFVDLCEHDSTNELVFGGLLEHATTKTRTSKNKGDLYNQYTNGISTDEHKDRLKGQSS